MKALRKCALIFLFAIIAFGGAKQVLAHATPVTYEPEASIVLEKTPQQIRIHFSERIEPGASGIKVFGPNGSLTSTEEARVDPRDARYYGVGMQEAGEGTHTVSWQVVSADDGHFTKGAFSFSVGKETAAGAGGQIQIQHITTLPQAVTIGIELVGQAILLGAFLLFALLWRPLRKKYGDVLDPPFFEKRLAILIGAGIFLMVVGVASFLVIKTFDLQQLRIADFPTTLSVFLGTVDGSFALYRAIAAIVVGVIFFAARARIFRSDGFTKIEGVLLCLLFIIVLDRARVSHAAASHFYPGFSIFVNFLHLAFKEFWVGGLIVISTVFLPLFSKTKHALAQSFTFTSFSQFVSVAFAGVGVTGAYIVWLHLKDPQYIFSTEWGSRFVILSLFAVVFCAARLWHQFLVEKSAIDICEGKTNDTKERLVRSIRYSLPFETLVGTALLCITGFIIITTPPYSPVRYAFEKQAIRQNSRITLAVHPYEQNQFLVAVTDAGKKSETRLSDIVVTATNAEKSIGPIVVETAQRFVGGYAFPRSSLTPVGNWRIDISARRPGAYDAVASFLIDYPREVEATRIHPDVHSFGPFEAMVLLAACGILILAFFLFRRSGKLNLACANLSSKDSVPPPQTSDSKLNQAASWFIACGGLIAVSFLVSVSYDRIFKTDFQKLCEKNGHFWLQSAPVRDGLALSSDTVTGCFLDAGLYHFGDKREYMFFLQKKKLITELDDLPATPVAGIPTDFVVSLSEILDGKKIGPAKDIGTYHDRILHAIIAGEDLETFAHIHPEDLGPVTDAMRKEARFPFRHTFPKAGRYAITVDYVASGRELSKSFAVHISGEPKMEQKTEEVPAGKSRTKEFGDYRVTLTAPRHIKAGERVTMSYYIEKNGTPAQDLEPYLAAAMHIAIVRQDLSKFTHTHGEASQPGSVWFQQLFGKYFKYHTHFAPDRFGPEIVTQPWTTVFPTPGVYRIFGEFKHNGAIVVTKFTLQAE